MLLDSKISETFSQIITSQTHLHLPGLVSYMTETRPATGLLNDEWQRLLSHLSLPPAVCNFYGLSRDLAAPSINKSVVEYG